MRRPDAEIDRHGRADAAVAARPPRAELLDADAELWGAEVRLASELPPALIPRQSTRAFTDAINLGDLRAAAHCFTLDACLTTPDATTIRGRDEIRPILAQLIARKSQIEVQASSILVAGEVALGSERWAIRSAGAEGAVFEQHSSPTLVLRLVEDAWKLAIATLWGLRAAA